MHHFFVAKENITESEIRISGADYNHAVNVLRLNKGERVLISDGEGRDYECEVAEIVGRTKSNSEPYVRLNILSKRLSNNELPARVVLYMCLPKADKMELIIEKAVELGVSEIVPVISRNCVVKLDDKGKSSKLARWQNIALAAAKQSKRSIIPIVREPIKFTDAVKELAALDLALIPYENENGMETTCEAIVNFIPGKSIGVIIGPEGGFDPMEVSLSAHRGVLPISLGKRILRTETAAISILSIIMIRLELASVIGVEG